MRVFVAVEIDDAVRGVLADAQATLKRVGGIKWVEPRNFHITLRFLGETDRGTVSRLVNRLGALAAGSPAFRLEFAGVGVFPNERRPRVVWAGITGGFEQLFALAQGTEAICQEIGFEPESKPFAAHLTLGRVKEALSGAELGASLAALADRQFGSQQVNQIIIMESTLTGAGPIYRPVGKLSLNNSAAGEPNAEE